MKPEGKTRKASFETKALQFVMQAKELTDTERKVRR